MAGKPLRMETWKYLRIAKWLETTPRDHLDGKSMRAVAELATAALEFEVPASSIKTVNDEIGIEWDRPAGAIPAAPDLAGILDQISTLTRRVAAQEARIADLEARHKRWIAPA